MTKDYKERMFDAFKLICQMEIDVRKKTGMLTYLFSMEPNQWRVVGVSKDALRVFKEHGFKSKSKMGINRSHIKRRYDSYIEIMKAYEEGKFQNHLEWWNFYFDNDETYLTTASENMRKSNHSEIIMIENPGFNLFRSVGFGWKHGPDEEELLRKLHELHIKD